MPDPDPRDAIHDAIQEHAPIARAQGAILTGWALVAEWMDESGERWLSRAYSAGKAQWEASGMHHEVLYGKWPDAD